MPDPPINVEDKLVENKVPEEDDEIDMLSVSFTAGSGSLNIKEDHFAN